jgi:hypothetical protein
MPLPAITVAPLASKDLDGLRPLLDEFVATHRSLRFRDGYWNSFRDRMAEKTGDQDTLALAAHVDGKLSGFAVATIQENGPLLAPA